MVEMGVQAGDAEQVTPDRGGADLLGRGDPSTGEAPCYQGRCAHTTRACKHQAPPTQNQSWHLKSFAGAYHLPLHFYEDRFAKTCHFQYHLFQRKKMALFEGVIKI